MGFNQIIQNMNDPVNSFTITTTILDTQLGSVAPVVYIRANSTNPTSIEAGGSVELYFEADGTFYTVPSENNIIVTGVTSKNWSATSSGKEGCLTLTGPTGNITVTLKVAARVSSINLGPFISDNNTPIDPRLILSKNQMPYVDDSIQPDFYFCLCRDDKQFYVYDKTASIDSETGRFRLFIGGAPLLNLSEATMDPSGSWLKITLTEEQQEIINTCDSHYFYATGGFASFITNVKETQQILILQEILRKATVTDSNASSPTKIFNLIIPDGTQAQLSITLRYYKETGIIWTDIPCEDSEPDLEKNYLITSAFYSPEWLSEDEQGQKVGVLDDGTLWTVAPSEIDIEASQVSWNDAYSCNIKLDSYQQSIIKNSATLNWYLKYNAIFGTNAKALFTRVVHENDTIGTSTSNITYNSAFEGTATIESTELEIASISADYFDSSTTTYPYGQLVLKFATWETAISPIDKTDEMTQDVGKGSDGKLYTKPSVSPVDKTDEMTQAVGKGTNGTLWTKPSVSPVDKTIEMTQDVGKDSEGKLYTKPSVSPVDKTDDMTQDVGKDSEGKLYTKPSVSPVDKTDEMTLDVGKDSEGKLYTKPSVTPVDKTDEMTQDVGKDSEGKLYTKPSVTPVDKTDDMTQTVGKDTNGALWTAPSGIIKVNNKTGSEITLYASDIKLSDYSESQTIYQRLDEMDDWLLPGTGIAEGKILLVNSNNVPEWGTLPTSQVGSGILDLKLSNGKTGTVAQTVWENTTFNANSSTDKTIDLHGAGVYTRNPDEQYIIDNTKYKFAQLNDYGYLDTTLVDYPAIKKTLVNEDVGNRDSDKVGKVLTVAEVYVSSEEGLDITDQALVKSFKYTDLHADYTKLGQLLYGNGTSSISSLNIPSAESTSIKTYKNLVLGIDPETKELAWVDKQVELPMPSALSGEVALVATNNVDALGHNYTGTAWEKLSQDYIKNLRLNTISGAINIQADANNTVNNVLLNLDISEGFKLLTTDEYNALLAKPDCTDELVESFGYTKTAGTVKSIILTTESQEFKLLDADTEKKEIEITDSSKITLKLNDDFVIPRKDDLHLPYIYCSDFKIDTDTQKPTMQDTKRKITFVTCSQEAYDYWTTHDATGATSANGMLEADVHYLINNAGSSTPLVATPTASFNVVSGVTDYTTLTWTDVPEAVYYRVYANNKLIYTLKRLGTDGQPVPRIFNGLENNISYTVTAWAYGPTGGDVESLHSNIITINKSSLTPEVSITSNRNFTLKWAHFAGASSYIITDNNKKSVTIQASPDASGIIYYNTISDFGNDLTDSKTYKVQTIYTNATTGTTICSNMSDPVTLSLVLPVISYVSDTNFTIEWSYSEISKITQIEVWGKLHSAQSTDYKKLVTYDYTIEAPTVQYTDVKLGYDYYIRACQVIDASTIFYSGKSNVKTPELTVPVLSFASANDHTTITWAADSHATKYYIYKNTTGSLPKISTASTAAVTTCSYGTEIIANSDKCYYYWVRAVQTNGDRELIGGCAENGLQPTAISITCNMVPTDVAFKVDQTLQTPNTFKRYFVKGTKNIDYAFEISAAYTFDETSITGLTEGTYTWNPTESVIYFYNNK